VDEKKIILRKEDTKLKNLDHLDLKIRHLECNLEFFTECVKHNEKEENKDKLKCRSRELASYFQTFRENSEENRIKTIKQIKELEIIRKYHRIKQIVMQVIRKEIKDVEGITQVKNILA
jgi:hypothetical protein